MNNKEPVDRKRRNRILRDCYYAFLRFYRRLGNPRHTNSERDLKTYDQLALASEALQDSYWRLRTLVKPKFAEEDRDSQQTLTQCCEKIEDLYWQLRAVLKARPPKNQS